MNSKHSFKKYQPNSLLKQVFIEFSEATKKPAQLKSRDGYHILSLGAGVTETFVEEGDLISYMRDEIKLANEKSKK